MSVLTQGRIIINSLANFGKEIKRREKTRKEKRGREEK
jgi:hypothetical protein